MDTGNIVRKHAEKEDTSGGDFTREVNQLHADLRDVAQIAEAMAKLEDDHSWLTFQRVLIEPTRERVKRDIERLTKELKDSPNNVSQIVYNEAFLEVLIVMSDFSKLRKKYAMEQQRIQERLKQLQKGNK